MRIYHTISLRTSAVVGVETCTGPPGGHRIQGFSRVVTCPEGRVRSFPQSRGASLVGSRGVRNLTGRVGLGLFLVSRVGSGRVGSGRVALIRPDPRKVTRPVKVPEQIPRLPELSTRGVDYR